MANEPTETAVPAAAPAIPAAAPTESPAPASPDLVPSVTPAPATESVKTTDTKTTFLDGAAPESGQEAAPTPEPETNKPAEGDKQPEADKDQGDKSVEPAPLPVYEPWTLPEDIKLDEAQSGEFSKLLGEFQNTTKAEQAYVQKFGQTLVDKHVTALNESLERQRLAYDTAWQTQTDGWRESFIKDPEIGGNRQETTIRLANEFIDTHGGTPEQKAAFREVMKQTGLGVNPEVLRLLSGAMNKFREGRPLPASPPKLPAPSRTQRMYGKKTG